MLRGLDRNVRNQEGFTLIELIVVVAILGILAAVVTPRVINALSDAKEKSALAFGKQVQLAMERYYVDNATYPQVDDDLNDQDSGLGALLGEYLNIEAEDLLVDTYTPEDDTYTLVIDVGDDKESRPVSITPTSVEVGDSSDRDADK